jgi:hypothetical protein
MSTFAEIRTLVLNNVGRNDATAISIIDSAINYSVLLASLIFEPPEMYRTGRILLSGGDASIYLPNVVIDADYDQSAFSGLFELDENNDLMPFGDDDQLMMNCLDVIKLFNRATALKMDFIPYENWEQFIPSSLATTKYWTMFGDRLIVGATPTINTQFIISYTVYPELLTSDDDELPFDKFDNYIVSTTTSIAFAAFEESDSSTLWSNISSWIIDPARLSTRAKALIEGRKTLIEKVIE